MNIIITLTLVSLLIIVIHYFRGMWKHILGNVIAISIIALFVLWFVSWLIELL